MLKLECFKLPFLSVDTGVDTLINRMSSCQVYKKAEPYPHVVIDDALNPRYLEFILKEWPSKGDKTQEKHNDGKYVVGKTGTTYGTKLGFKTDALIKELNSPKFLIALERLTGIERIIPDPYLFGGGLHTTQEGGRLAVHVDFNKHLKYKLDRRLNLILYLNKNWTADNQGELEMWDASGESCVKSLLPIFNRMVIFSTSTISYHGQPKKVIGRGKERKSLAIYYYSNGRPEEGCGDLNESSTVWV